MLKWTPVIHEFEDEYRFLSNFYPSAISVPGMGVFRTGEHLYQALKTLDEVEREAIMDCETPGQAKRLGAKLTLRDDWDDVKYRAMQITTARKFYSNPDLFQLLLDTQGARLVEGNTWHDNYWGACSCEECALIPKENKLGEILMTFRYQAHTWSKLDI